MFNSKEQKIYDTLCEQFGTNAIDFFTTCLGTQILNDNDIIDELKLMGLIEDDDD